jgi:hypothetical protein
LEIQDRLILSKKLIPNIFDLYGGEHAEDSSDIDTDLNNFDHHFSETFYTHRLSKFVINFRKQPDRG